MSTKITNKRPVGLTCEAKVTVPGPMPGTTGYAECGKYATHIYGPECEAETGKLMYLCKSHTELIETWRAEHLNDPVECPTHGRIGRVKDYLVLAAM